MTGPASPLRVMFDAQIFERQRYGGISRMFVELARELPDAGITPRFFAPIHGNAYLGELPAAAFIGGQRQVSGRLQMAAARRLPILLAPLAARLDGAGIVHETYYGPRNSAPRGVPMVTTLYDMIHELDPSFAGDPVIGWKAAAIARADWITCISHNTRADLIRLFPAAEARSSVVPLASDLPDAGAAPSPHPRPYLLYVGERSRDYKNFAGLFEAYRSSLTLNREFDLLCIGFGPFDAGERAMINDAGLAGKVHQLFASDQALAALYAHAACFVYPSTYEGFGIPPLEAMGARCPVVALRLASMPEVCGEAACYAESPDGEALGEAIRAVVFDPAYADRLRLAGRERAQQFSWRRTAKLTAQIYRQLAG